MLSQLGLRFECLPQAIDETPAAGEPVEEYVLRLAQQKAAAGWRQALGDGLEVGPVMGADTAVYCDGQILGKPRNEADALAMLATLAGVEHGVYSAVALVMAGRTECIATCTRVRFRPLESGEAEQYWATGEPADKAGAYAIQGIGARFVEAIDGSYSGVVGLPLVETQALLARFGIVCGW